MTTYKISKKLIDNNDGDFVAAVQEAGLNLPEHDELRWNTENIEVIKNHKVIAEIEVK